MNTPWDVIKEIEGESGRLNKEAIIEREMTKNNVELFEGFKLVFDLMITFGVKKIEHKHESGKGFSWKSFVDLTTKLANRDLTGNAAITAINYARHHSSEDQWNYWYKRILSKDMGCGISEKTINKIVKPEFQIPVFTCQLAHDGAKHESKITGNKLIEVKLDGVRVLTIVYPNGQVFQYSRNGKELLNFDHIKQQFAKHAGFLSEPMVFDGEVMSSSFQDLMKQIHRKENVKASDAVLYLFDMIPLTEFRDGLGTQSQVIRSALLKGWHGLYAQQMPNIAVVEQEMVDLDTDAGYARFLEINAKAIEIDPKTGKPRYEGIMLKELNDVYECKRTTNWLKIKPFVEVSLTAVAVEEGTGKNIGKMGAVLFEGTDDGKFIRVSVGSGWSDKDREDIWENKDLVLGEVGEVRADAATLSQDSDTVWSLRFPRFKTWRGFVPGEKI